MPFSMTGFVRQQQQLDEVSLTIEIRSVNSRYLDVSIHLPDEFRSLEFDLKKIASNLLMRGKVGVSILFNQTKAASSQITYNKDYAKTIADTLHEIDRLIYNAAPVNAVDILNWPGVLIDPEHISQQAKDELITLFKQALEDLQQARKREGDVLAKFLLQRCDEIMTIVKDVESKLAEIIEQHKGKLEAKLKAYQQQLDETRLEQEIVLFVQKMDIAEELDRIVTHIDEVKRILNLESGAQGRRLDFLMQELNREANTIGSKSASAKTSRASVELKVLIEQMREQIQNIE
jgi:uncharacterized protein (TIGR00255 family)